MISSSLEKNNWLTYGLLVFLAAIYTQASQYYIQADIDGGMVWAVNEFFEFRQTEAFYYPLTNGPLNILRLPTEKNMHLVFALLFQFSARFLLGYYLLRISQESDASNYKKTLLIYLFLLSTLNIDFILIGLVLAASYYVLQSNKTISFIPGAIMICCGLFIKGSISFPLIGIYVSLILILLYAKKATLALKIIGIQLILFIISCCILYANPVDGIQWFVQAILGSLAYGSTQAIYFNNTPLLLIPALVLILIVPYFIYKKEQKHFYFLSFIVILIFWKYVLGRQDFTHYQAWSFLCFLLIGFSFLLRQSKNAFGLAICYFLSFLFFTTNTQRADSPKKFTINTPNLTSFARSILKPNKVKQEYASASNKFSQACILSDSLLQMIGDQSVDAFPWEQSIIRKYKLNYKPRPNFYSTLLGPFADQSDAKHYASDQAPQFIIWHQSEPKEYQLNSHNNIYLINTIPEAVKSIQQHYQFLLYNNGYSLWQKKPFTSSKESKEKTNTKKVKLNTWFTAPPFDSLNSFIARTDFTLSWLDRCRSLLYKSRYFSISYKFLDGSEINHRLNLSSLQNHFLIQPYFINPSLDYKVVDKIKIEPIADQYKNSEIKLQWQAYFDLNKR